MENRLSIRRRLAVVAAVIASGIVGTNLVSAPQAGAAAYNACPADWWVHDQTSPGVVMQCVSYGNHIVIRQWVGGIDGGVVYEAWQPAWLSWTYVPDTVSGGSRGYIYFCGNTNPMAISAVSYSPGWERQFVTDYGSKVEGVFNHWRGWGSAKPFGVESLVGGHCTTGSAMKLHN